jgi:hypothetical protein
VWKLIRDEFEGEEKSGANRSMHFGSEIIKNIFQLVHTRRFSPFSPVNKIYLKTKNICVCSGFSVVHILFTAQFCE